MISMSGANYDEALTPCKDTTLSIVVSQHNRYLLSAPELLPYLRQNSDKVWLITQEPPAGSYQKEVDETLFVHGNDQIRVECHTILDAAEIIGQYCWKLAHTSE